MSANFRRRLRKTRPSHPPESSSALMPGLFRWLKLDEGARGFAAQRAFNVAAGPRVAARARAERLRGSTLFIRVVSAAWSHELHALKEELLAKLKATPGGESVEDLRFAVGPLDELPVWELSATDAAAEVVDERPLAVTATAAPTVELQAALRDVQDPELRMALKRLFVRQRK